MFRKISSISLEIWGGALIRTGALITVNMLFVTTANITLVKTGQMSTLCSLILYIRGLFTRILQFTHSLILPMYFTLCYSIALYFELHSQIQLFDVPWFLWSLISRDFFFQCRLLVNWIIYGIIWNVLKVTKLHKNQLY